ncbi:MAG: hypothetical protein Kow00121_29790 [Elainellaceae cyanobacterium]
MSLWLADGGVTVAKGSVGSETPEELRRQPKGSLPHLKQARDGLENKSVQTVK